MQRSQVQDYEEIECLQESNFKPDKRCHQSINTVAPPNSIFTSLFFCSAFIVSEVNEPLEQAKKNVIYITARSSSSLHAQPNTSFSLRFSGDNNFALEVVLIRVYFLTGNKLNSLGEVDRLSFRRVGSSKIGLSRFKMDRLTSG